jgi:hypothetical protein
MKSEWNAATGLTVGVVLGLVVWMLILAVAFL